MILVLSGTADGREIAVTLSKHGFQVLVSAATSYGGMLHRQGSEGAAVREGVLTRQEMEELITGAEIKAVVDATHPFAAGVSRAAVEACGRRAVPYLRYEREETRLEPGAEGIIAVSSFSAAAEKARQFAGTVFLTVGSRHLAEFCRVIPLERLAVRVLPQSEVLKKCEELGLLPRSIVAMQGPFSRELNREMFRQYRAGVIVTKDSGRAGGTLEKISAARDLRIPVVLVKRPAVEYPLVVRDKDELLEELGRILGIQVKETRSTGNKNAAGE
ncbi:MAG: precorrin-6A reductase [Peptococcaceae bacterium]|jgi:precorrin-6A/cobalt-precorrin-6A reductase|nr:precorrin-6A reductase [Peptococcaceae bacterium]MDH7525786.1 precorrin-6A reductase [Peptococcaceae bacterium]